MRPRATQRQTADGESFSLACVAAQTQLEMAFYIRPLSHQNAVHHDIAHAAVPARPEMANDAVLLGAQRFNRALRPKVEVVGPEPNDFTTELLKRVRQEQQLARRVDVGALAALPVPGVPDLEAI